MSRGNQWSQGLGRSISQHGQTGNYGVVILKETLGERT